MLITDDANTDLYAGMLFLLLLVYLVKSGAFSAAVEAEIAALDIESVRAYIIAKIEGAPWKFTKN